MPATWPEPTAAEVPAVWPGSTGTGPAGPPGPPGPAPQTYIYHQLTPSTTWTIAHGLGGFPAVTTVDSSGAEMIGDVEYVDANNLAVTFTFPEGGSAYLNI